MFNRRDVLKGFAAGAVGAVTVCSLEGPVADASLVDIVKAEKFPSVDGKPLINKPRAYQVLEEENIDGLVALDPVNVYYLTNTWSIGAKMRRQYPALTTFARDPNQPSFLIATTSQLWDISNRRSEVPEVMPYTGPANWEDYIGADAEQMKIEPKARERNYTFSSDAQLSSREQGWADIQAKYHPNAAPSEHWALPGP